MSEGTVSELQRLLVRAHERQAAGDYAGAQSAYRDALRKAPNDPVAVHGLAGVLVAGGDPVAAAALLDDALRMHPRDAVLHATLGLVRKAEGRLEEAERCLAAALELAPDLAEAWVNLGNVHEQCARWTQAEHCYRRALALRPQMAVAHSNLGTALQAQGRIEEAIACYRQALALRPGYAAALDHLGTALLFAGRAAEAEANFRAAVDAAPGSGRVLKHLGDALQSQGRLDQALDCYRRARAADPGDAGAAAGEAAVCEWQGRKREAAALVDPLIAAGSDDLSVLLVDARLRAEGPGRDAAVARLESKLAGAATAYERRRLHFALARLYDRAHRAPQAFAHLERGNALRGARFDAAAEARRVQTLVDTFSEQAMPALPRSAVDSDAMVFIVGMPRSGTTLVERIIGAHPQVLAAGERDGIERIVAALSTRDGGYPESVRTLLASDLDRFARGYLDGLGSLPAETRRVTDKTPLNFLHLGLIAMLFPAARVVHCVRDAADTCLSCYFQDFEQGHAFAYDLRDLGAFYRLYVRLMRHWQSVLPLPVLKLDYEQLVAEPEGQSRRLLQFCGLEWDSRCLRFHETKTTALTASYDQVRRPLYRDSVARHRAYERHLEPLRRALAGEGGSEPPGVLR